MNLSNNKRWGSLGFSAEIAMGKRVVLFSAGGGGICVSGVGDIEQRGFGNLGGNRDESVYVDFLRN